jgi:hypothetical protein
MVAQAAQKVKDIEEARTRLGDHLQQLEERLPAPADLARRAVALAAGGGTATTVFWFVVRRIRKRRKAKRAEQERIAVVNLLPEELSAAIGQAFENGQWKGWLAGFGAAWLLFRFAELRQLRRMQAAMASRG